MFFNRGKDDIATTRPAIRRVLVVEDEPLVAFDNEHALTSAGYEIAATVDDYNHAVAAIDEGGIDLLVADVTIQGDKTGIDLADYARGRNIPVVFVTGSCPSHARHLAMGCLTKPYLPRDLVTVIRAIDIVLAGRRPRRLPPGFTLFDRLR